MKSKHKLRAAVVAAQVLALAIPAGAALASSTAAEQKSTTTTTDTSGDAAAAIKHVNDAAAVIKRMEADPALARLLAQAKGVYVMPTYGRAAFGLGASGGAGVFAARRADGAWSDPAFFNAGGISIGLQAGAEGGPVVLILNNDKAVSSFKQKNNFNLSADAGLTVVNWSKEAAGTAGNGDVVVWSGSKGLFGNVATLAINDVRFNQKATQAYYGKPATVTDIVEGKATSAHSAPFKQALSSATGKH